MGQSVLLSVGLLDLAMLYVNPVEKLVSHDYFFKTNWVREDFMFISFTKAVILILNHVTY